MRSTACPAAEWSTVCAVQRGPESLPHSAARVVRRALNPTMLRGVALETAWVSAHIAMYPLGLLGERARAERERFTLTGLPPSQRGLLSSDVEAAGTPILLVHGLVDNRSIFTVLRRTLRRRGFGRVCAMNYSVLTPDLTVAADRLAAHVERLCADTGYERVHVIGHSLGGLIARYYVQRMGGDARVHTLVSLGTPHGGTRTARILPTGLARQIRPGSELLDELAGPAAGCRTRFLSVWSDLDQLMVPRHTARLDHPDLAVRNVLVRGVGHLSLPIDGRVVHEVCATLAHLDVHGGTLTAGVTAIGPGRDAGNQTVIPQRGKTGQTVDSA